MTQQLPEYDEAPPSPGEAIKIPAILLIIFSSLSIVAVSFHLLSTIIQTITHTPPPAFFGTTYTPEQLEAGRIGAVAFDGLGIILSAIMLLGAISMIRLRNLAFARTAAILAVIPCTAWCCCFLNLPIGIWALIVLAKPEVKAAFRK